MLEAGTLISLGGALLAGGAAWGGVQVSLSSMRGRVKAVERAFEKHTESDEELAREVIQRLARIESKLEQRGE